MTITILIVKTEIVIAIAIAILIIRFSLVTFTSFYNFFPSCRLYFCDL